MILGYAARNAMTPKVNPEHLAEFAQMAQKENPGLAGEMPDYQGVGSQIAQRIETLDPDRRRVAHEDLNDNLLEHVAQALASGTTGKSVDAIRSYLGKLADRFGVGRPKQFIEPGALGPGMELTPKQRGEQGYSDFNGRPPAAQPLAPGTTGKSVEEQYGVQVPQQVAASSSVLDRKPGQDSSMRLIDQEIRSMDKPPKVPPKKIG